MLNPLANGKIQGLFNAFECFSSTFLGKFYFQVLFKTVLYIQVRFKPVRTLYAALNHLEISSEIRVLPGKRQTAVFLQIVVFRQSEPPRPIPRNSVE